MHGRVKVKTTAEKAEEKRKEREAKAEQFKFGLNAVFAKRKEEAFDDEAFGISAKLLSANPDVYTLWNYRREIILHRKPDALADDNSATEVFQKLCDAELELTIVCLKRNVKSYNAWHQRAWIIGVSPKPDLKQEIVLCNQFLDLDERNFHCWDYRRFVCQQANVSVSDELDYTLKKIKQNFSNFSSWFYRSSLFTEACDKGLVTSFSKDKWDDEYNLVENAVFTDPTDQSAWFYHKWLSSISFGNDMNSNKKKSRALPMLTKFIIDKTKLKMVLFLDRVTRNLPLEVLNENGKSLSETFKPMNEVFSDIWYANLPCDLKALKITSCENEVNINLEDVMKQIVVYKSNIPARSGSKYSLKSENIESLKCLLQMEPENKWINSAVSLVESVDQLDTVNKLIELDPLRRKFYLDQRSKLLIDEHRGKCNLSFSLLQSKLTSFYSTSDFAHSRFIDLSCNELTVIGRNFNELVCLEILVLDNNKISVIDRNIRLLSLKVLSIQHNKISSTDNIRNLRHCSHLEKILMSGNPLQITEDLGFSFKLETESSNDGHLNEYADQECIFLDEFNVKSD
ncbi:Geranylgeranyl transferase type-2 subunit alpha [Halotydeus destructor]|nr:Geranylgeranyl transferase type-2 subunit alpha [Halotydeus destructor]